MHIYMKIHTEYKIDMDYLSVTSVYDIFNF